MVVEVPVVLNIGSRAATVNYLFKLILVFKEGPNEIALVRLCELLSFSILDYYYLNRFCRVTGSPTGFILPFNASFGRQTLFYCEGTFCLDDRGENLPNSRCLPWCSEMS